VFDAVLLRHKLTWCEIASFVETLIDGVNSIDDVSSIDGVN
jgi:hypothetical protein